MSLSLTPLLQLREGERGTVAGFSLPESVRLRLMELGFVEGSEVRLIRFAPLSDPLEVSVLGVRLAIRRREAGGILLKRIG